MLIFKQSSFATTRKGNCRSLGFARDDKVESSFAPYQRLAGAEGKSLALQRIGGADRDRTGDPLLAKQVLSQLSYSPITGVVGLGRFELPTSPLSGVRSNQLSYRPAGCARVS